MCKQTIKIQIIGPVLNQLCFKFKIEHFVRKYDDMKPYLVSEAVGVQKIQKSTTHSVGVETPLYLMSGTFGFLTLPAQAHF
jgi:hypothetical protein